jgi:hypothetical protein
MPEPGRVVSLLAYQCHQQIAADLSAQILAVPG